MVPTSGVASAIPRGVISFRFALREINRRALERIIGKILLVASYPPDPYSDTPQPVGGFVTDLLNSWVEAECKLKKWEEDNPAMADKLRRHLANWEVWLSPGPDGRPQPKLVGPNIFEPDISGANGNEWLAYHLFGMFMVTAAPRAEIRICERCGGFYWNRWGHTNKRFCGRKCSQLQTAIEGQGKRLRAEHMEKNRRIRQSVKSFISRNIQSSEWRRWVAKDAGVSLNYLTRAVRRGAQGKPDGVKLFKWQMQYLRKFDKGRK
jgi:hypothetical protein